VEISCRDGGVPSLTSTRAIIVRVVDDNDNTPQLASEVLTVDVHENNHVADVILAVNATDLDDGRNAALTYHLEPLDTPQSFSDVVSIDVDSGVITTLTSFDFESRQTYSFLLTVSDGGLVSHSRVATVVLNILDDNDEVPTFIRTSYAFHVPENRAAGSTVGRIRATDADLSAQHRTVFYSLEGHDSRAFRVAAQTGQLFSRVSLDREAQPVWRFRARASNDPLFDPRSPLNIVDVVVYVSDVNDNFPVVRRPRRINETFVVRELLPAGHVVTRVEATDADDGQNARLTYAVINGGSADGRGGKRPLFVIDDANGDIMTSRDVRRDDTGRYTLLVAVSDSGLPRRLTTTQIIIIVNVTTHYLGGDLTPPATSLEEETDYTVVLIVGICCAAVLLKLIVVGAVCVRHNVSLRVHATSSSATTHKVSVTDQGENDTNNKAAKSSVWNRLHDDHRNDVMPSSCSVRYLYLAGQVLF